MTGNPVFDLALLPVGLGLFGFIEPCSLGATLVFIKAMEGRPAGIKVMQVSVFAVTRAAVIGLLGVAAALIGASFLRLQHGAWVVLGVLYVAIGIAYLTGRAGWFMRTIGPGLASLSNARGSAALGLLFGLNIPACAAPLLFALLGAAAARGAAGTTLAAGFASLGLFGLGLSLPLVIAVLFGPARRSLDWLAGLSRRLPFWTGLLLIVLGLWSIRFGLLVPVSAAG